MDERCGSAYSAAQLDVVGSRKSLRMFAREVMPAFQN